MSENSLPDNDLPEDELSPEDEEFINEIYEFLSTPAPEYLDVDRTDSAPDPAPEYLNHVASDPAPDRAPIDQLEWYLGSLTQEEAVQLMMACALAPVDIAPENINTILGVFGRAKMDLEILGAAITGYDGIKFEVLGTRIVVHPGESAPEGHPDYIIQL